MRPDAADHGGGGRESTLPVRRVKVAMLVMGMGIPGRLSEFSLRGWSGIG